MRQSEAPIGTVATIGHPANDIRIVKTARGWINLYTGKLIDEEDFRAGWEVLTLPPSAP